MGNVAELGNWIEKISDQEEKLDRLCFQGLNPKKVKERFFGQNVDFHQGNIRQCVKNPAKYFMVYTDQFSIYGDYSYDIPFQGSVLAALNSFWHQKLSSAVPTAWRNQSHDRIIEMETVTPIDIRFVVKAFTSGSIAGSHKKLDDLMFIPVQNKRISGVGDDQPPILHLTADGVLTTNELHQVRDACISLFHTGEKLYGEYGWIMADSQYEFGRDQNGEIVLIGQVHTPETSQLWTSFGFYHNSTCVERPDFFGKELIHQYLSGQKLQEATTTTTKGRVSIPKDLKMRLLKNYVEIYQKLAARTLEVDFNYPNLYEELDF